MSPILITALVLVGGIFLIIALLVFIHNRDKRRSAKNNSGE